MKKLITNSHCQCTKYRDHRNWHYYIFTQNYGLVWAWVFGGLGFWVYEIICPGFGPGIRSKISMLKKRRGLDGNGREPHDHRLPFHIFINTLCCSPARSGASRQRAGGHGTQNKRMVQPSSRSGTEPKDGPNGPKNPSAEGSDSDHQTWPGSPRA